MKLKCFLFTLLIGMMCFAGLRAETPDLKENPDDTTELISFDGISFDIVSNVSTVQEFEFTEFVLVDFDSGQNGLMADTEFTKGQSPKNVQTNSVLHTFKQDRNPRDGISCSKHLHI